MKNIILFVIISLMLICCKEEGRVDHIDTSGVAPPQVTITGNRKIPGGAVLKYTLPEDTTLLYVQAEYEIRPGVKRETKSSYLKDSLVMEGFGEARQYDVKIYSVGKNRKASEPLSVTIETGTPPVLMASKSIRETFGGIAIDIENPERTNLAVVLLGDTANHGYFSELYTFYTSMPKITFKYRGLDSIPYEFGVYLRDRWNNLSDTVIVGNLTPWYEEYIKKPWYDYSLDGDHAPIPIVYGDWGLHRIWDEETAGDAGFHGEETKELPSIITWNLGRKVKLCRFTLFTRNADYGSDDRWERGHPRMFEIYGSLAPNPNGKLDDTWIPLGEFECVKPSGPGRQVTQEDLDAVREGFEYDFDITDFAPEPQAVVQYMRFVTRETFAYSPISTVHINEISFWGSFVD